MNWTTNSWIRERVTRVFRRDRDDIIATEEQAAGSRSLPTYRCTALDGSLAEVNAPNKVEAKRMCRQMWGLSRLPAGTTVERVED